jgi:plasmid maintenance system antidote protein VapI
MTADPGALRDHLNELRLHGGTYRTIAAAAAVAPTTVHDLAIGRRVSTGSIARALLAVTSDELPQGRLDAGGTRLRLRALHVMGHSSARIARAVGASDKTIRKLVRGDAKTISPQLHDAIADVYDAWWDKRAPARSRAERSAASAARRRAIAAIGAPERLSTTTSWIPPATVPQAAGSTPPAPVPPRRFIHLGDLEGTGADDSDHPGREHQ